MSVYVYKLIVFTSTLSIVHLEVYVVIIVSCEVLLLLG